MSCTKLYILHGNNPMDGKILDGEISEVTADSYAKQHIISLVYFLKSHYLDNKSLQNLSANYFIEHASYVFSELGDVIFLDTTRIYSINNKTGCFVMPHNITEAQKECLLCFKERLKEYKSISIEYDINYNKETGELSPSVIYKHGDNACDDAIDEYLTIKKRVR